jgi:hypothetical protein
MLRPLRELFHAKVATKTQRSQRFLTTIKFPASIIIWCRYNFPEIKILKFKKTFYMLMGIDMAARLARIRASMVPADNIQVGNGNISG